MMRSGTTRSLVASELRTLHRKVHQAEGRLARSVLTGKVQPGSQDLAKRTVRLVLGRNDDGEDILSPPVRWQEPGAGTFKVHAVPADHEQMTLLSPSGTIGDGSEAVWGTYDDDHAPPSSAGDEAVLTFGDTRLTFRGDQARVSSPTVIVESEDIQLGADGGKPVARIGDLVNVGSGSSTGLWPIVQGSSRVRAVD
ncbi:phage baseplate protein [Amorphus sp. MBR-141]